MPTMQQLKDERQRLRRLHQATGSPYLQERIQAINAQISKILQYYRNGKSRTQPKPSH